MAGTHRGIADPETIKDGVGLGNPGCRVVTLAELVVEVGERAALPSIVGVERLHYGGPYRLAAHEHGNGPRGENRTGAVSVDLLEYQPQHRGADEGFALPRDG